MGQSVESRLSIWAGAARPKTLPAAIAPVVVGTAMAYGEGAAHWPSAVCALVGAVLIQIGTNLANDYFDFVKGTDTAGRLGPTRATQAGLVTPTAMRRAAALVFGAVLIPGAYILWRGGVPFLVIGVLSILCGVLYTAGPCPIGYVGLGDAFVLVFFGPVAVAGTYYLQARAVTANAVLSGVAVGLLAVALLTVNNLRDIDEDRAAGKRTLAVRFGRTFARIEYTACLAGAALVIPGYLYAVTGRYLFGLIPIAIFVTALPALRCVWTQTSGPVLNRLLATTGKLLLAYGILFAAGWAL
ncbi:MAG: 1,4-dihydroxy-2-naphthoate polyprenyltransferase [Candidatus Hydrogenedentes bacterium]|nr:1,4-dihydroxy-2-naphthoate polyprenyltransferase [Candidatus Hydrogenedentota bacterium]